MGSQVPGDVPCQPAAHHGSDVRSAGVGALWRCSCCDDGGVQEHPSQGIRGHRVNYHAWFENFVHLTRMNVCEKFACNKYLVGQKALI